MLQLQTMLAVFALITSFTISAAQAQDSVESVESVESAKPVDSVEQWLKLPAADRPAFAEQAFADAAISKTRAKEITDLLWKDHLAQLREQRKPEWDDKVISIEKFEMKFDYKVFGDKPESGRRLFISMHGGGGTRASVNEQQWRNQIGLYQPEEGVYLAPRAPSDKWNMWHADHIDEFFHRIIQSAMLFEDVDPNRVYIMGYSAGGDGVYQLAPRMADSLAAAAMMAGHPNGASPANLRNIGFALHMGANDSAYKRNKVAEKWKVQLAQLKKDDPEGYKQQVQIHEGMGHWMQRKDAVAVPWMSEFVRDPQPAKVVWRKPKKARNNFYWLAMDTTEGHKGDSELVVSRKGQSFEIETADNASDFRLQLNDTIADLDQEIEVTFETKTILKSKAQRKAGHIYRSIKAHSDPHRIYSSLLDVTLPKSDVTHSGGSPNNRLASDQEINHQMHAVKKNPTDDPEKPNVLLIGDSISMGYTPLVRGSLEAKADVFRIPSNGKDSSFGVEKLDAWLKMNSKWDVIHFNWGLWDICYRHPKSKVQGHRDKVNGTLTTTEEEYRANLETLVSRLKQTEAKLIWCETTPVPENEAGRKLGDEIRYNKVAAKIMQANEIAINDLHAHALQQLPGIAVKPGDVHFTKKGYKHLAQKVAQEIAATLPKPTSKD